MSPPMTMRDQALLGSAQPSGADPDYKNVGGAPEARDEETKQWDGTSWNQLATLPVGTDFGVGANGTGGGVDTMVTKASFSYIYTFSSDSWSADTATTFNTVGGAGGASASDYNLILWRGGSSGVDRQTDTAEFNGSSWSKVGDLNVAMNVVTGTGDQDDAISNAGLRIYYLTTTDLSELWDGSSDTWASTTDFPVSTYRMNEAGTSIDAMATADSAHSTATYTLAGTTWSSGVANPLGAYGMGAAGPDSTSVITAGGSTGAGPVYTDEANVWNDVSWVAITEMPDAEYGGIGNGVPP